MAQGGKREGAGRKKGSVDKNKQALRELIFATFLKRKAELKKVDMTILLKAVVSLLPREHDATVSGQIIVTAYLGDPPVDAGVEADLGDPPDA